MINTYGLNDEGNICVGFINKAASTAMGDFFRKKITAKEALEIPIRLAFPRDPYDRFLSFFFNLYTEVKRADYDITEFIPKSVMCRESVIEESLFSNLKMYTDYVLRAKPNAHWAPQLPQLMMDGELVPNSLHKFSDINLFWKHYFGCELPVKRNYSRFQVPDYKMSEFREYYKPDLIFGAKFLW